MAVKKRKKPRKNKPGAGRPRIHAEDSARILLLLSAATLAEIEAARYVNETRLDMIREAINRELQRRWK